MNRILRDFQGEPVPQDAPGTVPGELLSENQALSDLTELLGGSLPNEAFAIPSAVADAIGSAGFVRGWGGGYNFFVDPNNANASDSNTGRDASKPLATIQQAITNARAMSGDTIFVLQNDGWTYGSGLGNTITEAVIVTADKPGLRILGAGAGSMGVNWTAGVTGTFCLTINAIDAVVQGFNYWGDPVDCHGILCHWDGVNTYGENAAISNCTFADSIDIGIQLEYSWYAKINDCHFQECDNYGIFVDPAGSGMSYGQIVGNYFNDCTIAMALDDCDNSLIKDNWIYNTDAQVTGSATNAGLNTGAGAYNMVADNYFSCLLVNWDDFNSASATDAWINNHVINGNPTARPA